MWTLTPLRTRAGSPGIKDKEKHLIKHDSNDLFLLSTENLHILLWLSTWHFIQRCEPAGFSQLIHLHCQRTSLKRGWDPFVCITCTCPHCWVSCVKIGVSIGRWCRPLWSLRSCVLQTQCLHISFCPAYVGYCKYYPKYILHNHLQHHTLWYIMDTVFVYRQCT